MSDGEISEKLGTKLNGKVTNGTNGSNETVSHLNGHEVNEPLPKLLIWSTADQDGIKRLVQIYSEYFSENVPNDHEESYLERLAYTLEHHRSSLLWKSYTVVHKLTDLFNLEKLTSPAAKQISNPSIAFVFTGQGAQWARMGLELMAFSTLRASLNEAAEYLKSLGCDWSLTGKLYSHLGQ